MTKISEFLRGQVCSSVRHQRGNWYQDSDGAFCMLVLVEWPSGGGQRMCLVGLNGNRYRDPVVVKNCHDVTEDELARMFGGRLTFVCGPEPNEG